MIGADQVAWAPADGNTILLGNIGTQSINPILYKKLPYDAKTAFAPVSLVAELPQVLLVHPGVQASDVAGLITLLKAQPGKFSYSTSGPGGSMHLAGEMFKSATQTDIQHVAYRGGGPAIVDLLSGHVQITFATVLESLGHIKAGKLRALAVTGDKRAGAARCAHGGRDRARFQVHLLGGRAGSGQDAAGHHRPSGSGHPRYRGPARHRPAAQRTGRCRQDQHTPAVRRADRVRLHDLRPPSPKRDQGRISFKPPGGPHKRAAFSPGGCGLHH